jgi:2-oxoglutarate dehydrogenase E1 component
MVQYSRRFAERQANLFVVCATTPAQLFHALRRQMNRPFVKPLVLLTPKYLLHHRPATSALADFTTGTFFNRVIDDGKVCSPACARMQLRDHYLMCTVGVTSPKIHQRCSRLPDAVC